MITKEKIDKLQIMADNLVGSAGDDKRVRNCAAIFQLLLNHIDDMIEEVRWLKEENEALRFDLEDKKIEEGPRRRGRGEGIPTPTQPPRIMPWSDGQPPF